MNEFADRSRLMTLGGSDSMEPEKLFSATEKYHTVFVKFDKHGGSDPYNLFPSTDRASIFCRLQIDVGNDPVNSLSLA